MAITRFESLEQIESLVGYVKTLTKGERFARFIGFYRIADRKKWIHCARPECNQLHGFGYVVGTEAEKVAAIGNMCGAQTFGCIYEAALASFDAAIQRELMMAGLADSLARLSELKQRGEALLNGPRGALWMYTAEMSLLDCLPRRLLSHLYDRASRGDGSITESHEKRGTGSHGESEYVHKVVGVIQGIGALASPRPKFILEERVLQELNLYGGMTPGYLVDNRPRRDRFNQWLMGVPADLDKADSRLRAAVHFFQTRNLRLLAYLANNPADRHRLSGLHWNEARGIVELESKAA